MERNLILPARGEETGFERGSVFFVGTATVIIRYGDFTLLTDPNFLHAGDHVHLGYGLHSRRLTNPAVEIEDLPPLDLVVLSHHHGDHFDRHAAAGLDQDLPIVTEPHSARKLGQQGFRRALALETWESQTFRRGGASVRVTSRGAFHRRYRTCSSRALHTASATVARCSKLCAARSTARGRSLCPMPGAIPRSRQFTRAATGRAGRDL